MRPPVRLVDAVLMLYPPDLRDRYGPEIADLLDTSSRPWRDLGDVAWNAALDRTGTVCPARLRPHVREMVALMTFPVVFLFAMLVLLPTTVLLAYGAGRLFHGPENMLLPGGVVTVALVAAVASSNARRWIDSLDVPAPAFLVPTLLAIGCLGVTFVPPAVFVVIVTGTWIGTPSSILCWWLMVTVLGARFRVLTGQGRTVAARRLAVVGTLLVLAVTYAINLAALRPADRSSALLFFLPMTVPSLVAVCTSFTFALLAAATPPAPAVARSVGEGFRFRVPPPRP